ncbi:MAG: hypothetical protein DVS81_01585 [Candidatus Accumulibacter meliphilus]|jgi:hypothetical protein|uniref:Uncharacterized protein n=1 Tax=Candidatus Accumulibacter meliphilus TaxID=2211374 RepID=A0A369XQQ0_9PROT|nr:MAG: hypothetical protein DVS81_01585 [Candidatus Accumulibacter meliphilus]
MSRLVSVAGRVEVMNSSHRQGFAMLAGLLEGFSRMRLCGRETLVQPDIYLWYSSAGKIERAPMKQVSALQLWFERRQKRTRGKRFLAESEGSYGGWTCSR